MSRDSLNWFRCVVACLALFAIPAGAQQPRVVDKHVEGPRPVAKAINELTEQNYHRVTYEDPRYEYQGDIKDVTAEFRNPLNTSPSDPRRRTLIPMGGYLDLRYTSSSANDEPDDWGETVRSIVDAQQTVASGGHFRVLESGDWLHVIPAEARNSQGEWTKQTPILDAPITISAQQLNGLEALNTICDALSEVTGQRVVVGVVPVNAFARYVGKIEASNEPGRDVLVKLFDSASELLSWQIFYAPDEKWYVLNAYTVAPPPETSAPVAPTLRRPGDPSPSRPAETPR